MKDFRRSRPLQGCYLRRPQVAVCVAASVWLLRERTQCRNLLHVSNGVWDHDAFRDYVVSRARRAGVATRNSELAAATGIDQGVISRWFRGKEQPSVANLKKLAAGIPGVSVPELMIVAGRASAEELGVATPQAVAAHRLAQTVDRLLGEDSPLSDSERDILATLIDRVVSPYQPGSRRSA